MREYFENQRGLYMIAKTLNDRAISSPRGKPWCMSSVKTILMNRLYTGTAVANRVTEASFVCRSPDRPKEVRSRQSRQKGRQQRLRPAEEWMEVPCIQRWPEYLPSGLRETVIAAQMRNWTRLKRGDKLRGPIPQRHKHPDSPFLLTGFLRTRQGNLTMCGSIRDKRSGHRYYQEPVARTASPKLAPSFSREFEPTSWSSSSSIRWINCSAISQQ